MVNMQVVSQAALSLFCVSCGVGIVVMLVRDATIQRLKKQVKDISDRLEAVTVKRFDEAVEYSDLVFSVSKRNQEELDKRDKQIEELNTEVENLRHRNKQLERGIK